MKKHILACTMSIALGLPFTPAKAVSDIPYLDRVVIDGELADWPSAWVIGCLAADSVLPPAKSAASAKLAWDDVGLLVACEVVDPTPSEAFRASAAYMQDSVELFLAADPQQNPNFQVVISPGNDSSQHPAARHFFFDNRPESLRELPATCEYATRITPIGYTLEARIPWAALGLQPQLGTIVGSRLFVNDHNGNDRIRFAWAPQSGHFHSLRLAKSASPPLLAAGWTAFDPHALAPRLNILGPTTWAGQEVRIRDASPPIRAAMTKTASGSSASMLFQPADGTTLLVDLPDGSSISVADQTKAGRRAVFRNANTPWRISPTRREEVAFARFGLSQHVFLGNTFPRPNFADPEKTTRLLGAEPHVVLTWLDAQGNPVDAPHKPGSYGCLAEITTPLGDRVRKTFTLYRLPDGAGPMEEDDEHSAQLLAFQLQGADATRSHATRIAARWWHQALKKLGKQTTYPFGIRLPKNYAERENERFPLLVFLHGTGFGGEGADEVFFQKFGPAMDAFDGVIVYPRASASWEAGAVQDVIDDVLRNYRIAESKICLAGFSMGGIGSWRILLDQPSRFAAAAIIGGRSGTPADAARLRDIPIRVINGQEDPTTTVEEAQLMVQALQTAGANVETHWLPGADHGPSMDRTLSDPAFYLWLRQAID